VEEELRRLWALRNRATTPPTARASARGATPGPPRPGRSCRLPGRG
jgi:hypothetical protein